MKMDRETLHALIDVATNVIACEGCREQFLGMIAAYAVHMAGQHNAHELANRVQDQELTHLEAYDELASTMRPLYDMVGNSLSDDDIARFRDAFARVINSRLN